MREETKIKDRGGKDEGWVVEKRTTKIRVERFKIL